MDGIEALPPETFDGVQVDDWRMLSLRCRVSGARLTDPARGEACAHLPSCNYRELCSMVSRTKRCPIDGCAAPLARSRAVQRDERLQKELASVPAAVDTVRVRSSGEVEWDAPRAADETNTVDLTLEGQAAPELVVTVKSEARAAH